MFTDSKEVFRQSKQKFRRRRIHLSRISVTNDVNRFEPDWGSEFLEIP